MRLRPSWTWHLADTVSEGRETQKILENLGTDTCSNPTRELAHLSRSAPQPPCITHRHPEHSPGIHGGHQGTPRHGQRRDRARDGRLPQSSATPCEFACVGAAAQKQPIWHCKSIALAAASALVVAQNVLAGCALVAACAPTATTLPAVVLNGTGVSPDLVDPGLPRTRSARLLAACAVIDCEAPLAAEAVHVVQHQLLTPQKTRFYVAYSNRVFAGQIGRGKSGTKAIVNDLQVEHGVRNAPRFFHQLKKQCASVWARLQRKPRTGDGMLLAANTPEGEAMRTSLVKFAVDQKFKFTYEMAAAHMAEEGHGRGCAKDSINKFIASKTSGWKEMYEGTSPLLQQRHRMDRMEYAKARLDEGEEC